MEGEIRFDHGQAVAAALLATEDGALRLQAEAAAGDLDLALQARDWSLPVGPAPRFESLQGRGRLEGRFYGGTLEASARGAWTGGPRLEGQAKVRDVSLAPKAGPPPAPGE